MDLGPHAAFIWLSYGAVWSIVAGLALYLLFDGRRVSRRLEALEARDAQRRGTSSHFAGPSGGA